MDPKNKDKEPLALVLSRILYSFDFDSILCRSVHRRRRSGCFTRRGSGRLTFLVGIDRSFTASGFATGGGIGSSSTGIGCFGLRGIGRSSRLTFATCGRCLRGLNKDKRSIKIFGTCEISTHTYNTKNFHETKVGLQSNKSLQIGLITQQQAAKEASISHVLLVEQKKEQKNHIRSRRRADIAPHGMPMRYIHEIHTCASLVDPVSHSHHTRRQSNETHSSGSSHPIPHQPPTIPRSISCLHSTSSSHYRLIPADCCYPPSPTQKRVTTTNSKHPPLQSHSWQVSSRVRLLRQAMPRRQRPLRHSMKTHRRQRCRPRPGLAAALRLPETTMMRRLLQQEHRLSWHLHRAVPGQHRPVLVLRLRPHRRQRPLVGQRSRRPTQQQQRRRHRLRAVQERQRPLLPVRSSRPGRRQRRSIAEVGPMNNGNKPINLNPKMMRMIRDMWRKRTHKVRQRLAKVGTSHCFWKIHPINHCFALSDTAEETCLPSRQHCHCQLQHLTRKTAYH